MGFSAVNAVSASIEWRYARHLMAMTHDQMLIAAGALAEVALGSNSFHHSWLLVNLMTSVTECNGRARSYGGGDNGVHFSVAGRVFNGNSSIKVAGVKGFIQIL